MTPSALFPAISPAMARELFLIRDASWGDRFKENFNQFIIAPLEYSWPIIKLPLPPSRTSNHALFMVERGQVDITIGHQAYTLRPNDLVIVPALQIFTLHSIWPDSVGFISFISQELLLGAGNNSDFDFLKLTGNPYIPLSDRQVQFVNALLNRLAVEYQENGATKPELIRPYLLALFAEIDRAYVGPMAIHTDVGERLVQRFMDLLTTRIRETRLTSQYADWLAVSPNHLNKVVKNRTDKSPSVWIDERVVLEAKVLLVQTELTVAQIAYEMGFPDQSSFGKLFRKYTDLTPTQFRSQFV
ncbi:helix-turn-helix domain-containing protein [Spirosoma panaciterrae]|uniref:helix-turn-helix domain-containing protein n=1 Tax=Spirosoma panaciterrae TaxID=496058 RepID=UPI00037A74F9|nr:helix-turn-helix domain-containing protein [Spirosoma panaciterrae]